MASHIFKNEIALYLMFSERTIKDCAYELDIWEKDLKTFIWMYYINKFVSKRPFINVQQTVKVFKALGNGLPTHQNTLFKILEHMAEKGYIERQGTFYRIDDTTSRAFANKMTRMFQQHLNDFRTFAENPNLKYRKPKAGRKRKVGMIKRKLNVNK